MHSLVVVSKFFNRLQIRPFLSYIYKTYAWQNDSLSYKTMWKVDVKHSRKACECVL